MTDKIPAETRGLHTALAEAQASGDHSCVRGQGEQTELLPLSQTPQPENGGEPGSPVRGKGRPAGSKNKSTEEWRDFILAGHRSPLLNLAEYSNKPLLQLWRELSGNTDNGQKPTFDQMLELMKLQFAMWRELAPYLHSKQPIAIDGGEHGLIQLVIEQGQIQHNAAASHGPLNVEFLNMGDDLESESDQGVSFIDVTESNAAESNAISQGVDNEE